MRKRIWLAMILAAAGAWAQEPATSKDWAARGTELYRSGRYPEAVAAYQNAVNLSPNDSTYRIFLATALMSQWIPGSPPPENADLERRAEAEFQAVLDRDPANLVALRSLASMALNLAGSIMDPIDRNRKLDEAAQWDQKIVQAKPDEASAYYGLGVIAWNRAMPSTEVNNQEDRRARFGTVIEDGIANLQKALEIDSNYSDAMAYMNLLLRQRAEIRDTPQEAARDLQAADEWVNKAMAAKKTGAASLSQLTAPPHPPPPPPPPGAPPSAIRVGGRVQENNLLTKVEPVYPPLARQARVQGTVRFNATIGTDGRILNLQLVSGHPLLIAAAQEAVAQWVYKPTLLNGQPVTVVTTAEVSFTLAN